MEDNDIVLETLKNDFGYDHESAIKVIVDVQSAMKKERLVLLQRYLNKRILVRCDSLHIECFVADVKVTSLGSEFLIRPVAGDKTKWIRSTDFLKPLK